MSDIKEILSDPAKLKAIAEAAFSAVDVDGSGK